ncbi:MAG: hypothetical protein ACLPY5_09870 [Candidatus Bathyarchaeia archaeon]
MKPNKNLAQNLTDLAIPFTGNDAQEYFGIRSGLIKLLERRGGYIPAIHDLYLDQAARHTIFLKKSDMFLMSDKASEHTFVSVADAKAKFAKIIDNALNKLGISPGSSFANQTEAGVMTELRELVMRGFHDPEKSDHKKE